MMIARRWKHIAALGLIAAATAVGTALATPSSGVTVNELARGLVRDHVTTERGRAHHIRTNEVVIQNLVLAPGGTTGWHSHPAPDIVVVKSGVGTLYHANDPNCHGERFGPGATLQGFIGRGPTHNHVFRNEGSVPVDLIVVYTGVPPGRPVRIDQPQPPHCHVS